MGVVDYGKPKFRVAHRFHLPYSTLHLNYHQIKMKSFIVLICVGMAIAGDDMFGHEKMKKQWTDYKAMESCFGEDMMKTSMLKMKKAVVKCTGIDMPELDLPMYKSPHRVVHALLESAEDFEQMKMMKVFQQLSQGQQQSNNQPQPIQLVLGQTQQQPQDNMFKKMMMKMMMKKMFGEQMAEPQAESYNDYKSSPFGNMGSRMNKDNKYEMMEKLMKTFMNQRNKRATDDVFELGDRLTEKLKQETVKMQAKLGNASCVLQELGIIDQNQNLDINKMVKSVEDGEWGAFPDQWLKEHHIKDCQNCATYADSITKPVFDECAYGEKWGRIILFFQCEKESKYKCCMNHDMKLKLEKSFGTLEELEQATGLPEYQLLPLTMKLLHDQMDMFM